MSKQQSRKVIINNVKTCRDYLNDAYTFLRDGNTVADASALAMMEEVVEIAKTQVDNIKRMIEE